jgi:hypothetical protein
MSSMCGAALEKRSEPFCAHHMPARQRVAMLLGPGQISIGNPHFRPLIAPKLLIRQTQKLAHLIASWRSTDVPNTI